jgi:hypothetical protein
MRLFNRKSQLQRFLETVTDALDVPGGRRLATPGGRRLGMPGGLSSPGKTLKDAVPTDKALKAGLIAGGLAGLTAGSAGISSLRRRKEGARDGS